MYDVAVVGAGLIGAAAAKYLAKKGLKVALIGPTEAQGALGACYDTHLPHRRSRQSLGRPSGLVDQGVPGHRTRSWREVSP
mmetsp:Transcript_31490/g.64898  ORF Transcript_31490/g.64898 Transcript_31490/m.64898 type:complete len:81 (-) Transcript_31490:11-253(-)